MRETIVSIELGYYVERWVQEAFGAVSPDVTWDWLTSNFWRGAFENGAQRISGGLTRRQALGLLHKFNLTAVKHDVPAAESGRVFVAQKPPSPRDIPTSDGGAEVDVSIYLGLGDDEAEWKGPTLETAFAEPAKLKAAHFPEAFRIRLHSVDVSQDDLIKALRASGRRPPAFLSSPTPRQAAKAKAVSECRNWIKTLGSADHMKTKTDFWHKANERWGQDLSRTQFDAIWADHAPNLLKRSGPKPKAKGRTPAKR